MPRPIPRTALFALAVLVCAPLQAQQDWLQADAERLLENHSNIPAVAIAVVRGGEVIAAAAAGQADPRNDIPMTVRTPVRIASVTKTYVAATLLLLAHRHSVPLDTPIEAWLPDAHLQPLRKAGYDIGAITLHHLLSHTAGLRSHGDSLWYKLRSTTLRWLEWTPLDTVRIAAGMGPPLAEPGARYHYSDTGYVLLGAIVERLADQPLHLAVRRTLDFDRLELHDTWWESLEYPPPTSAPRAEQFYRGFSINGLDPSVDLYGGGGLMSSAVDMARFLEALFDDRVLRPTALLDTLLEPGNLPADSSYRYGLYAWRGEWGPYYSHSGIWATAMYYFPHLDAAIAGLVTEKTAFPQLTDFIHSTAAQLREPPPVGSQARSSNR